VNAEHNDFSLVVSIHPKERGYSTTLKTKTEDKPSADDGGVTQKTESSYRETNTAFTPIEMTTLYRLG
jgi:hypothetical protein